MIQELDISPELLAELKQFAGVAQEQMLEVVNEYLTWWFWLACANCVGMTIMAVVAAIAAKKFWNKNKGKDWFETNDLFIGGAIVSAGISLMLFVVAFDNAMKAVKITVAPRAYIVDMVVAKGR